MQQNEDILSNTFLTKDVDAEGIYPLGDKSVMLASVMTSSKYTVLARMSIDWLSIDDIIYQLTKGLNVWTKVLDVLNTGMSTARDIDGLFSDKNNFETALEDKNTAKNKYTTKYNEYMTAVNDYNSLITDINDARSTVSQYEEEVRTTGVEVDSTYGQYQNLENRKKELEEDVDADGKPVDHKDEIEEINEQMIAISEKNQAAYSAYTTANTNLTNAQNELNSLLERVDGKKLAVTTAKNEYYNAIIDLRNQIASEKGRATALQTSFSKVVNDSESLVSSTVSAAVEIANESRKDQIQALQGQKDDIEVQKSLAGLDGYDQDTYSYIYTDLYNESQEYQSDINRLNAENVYAKTANQLTDESKNAMKSINSDFAEFAKRGLEDEYKTIYDELNRLAITISNVTIPSDNTKMSGTDHYYSFNNPLTENYVQELINKAEEAIQGPGTAFAFVKAIVNFINALFKIKTFYDPFLSVTISTSLYSANGGLPSKINRTTHPLEYSYAAEDAEQSQRYKDLMNTFTSGQTYSDISDMGSIFEQIMKDITELVGIFGDFKISKIPELFGCLVDLVTIICTCPLSTILKSAGETIKRKVLPVGYISYNTANRTTYSGKALTGASFGLPSAESANGYVFAGAETEYIYNGSTSEYINQSQTFLSMLLVRMLMDAPAILSNSTVLQLAVDAAPILFGLGAFLVIVAYFLLESFLDTIILANGGTLPLFKSYVFLTPDGVLKLVDKITSIPLSDKEKQAMFEDGSDAFYELDPNINFKRYEEYVDTENNRSGLAKFTDNFTVDYTKTLQLLLLFFRSNDTLISRLSDIIEMEGRYKFRNSFVYNLDKSYTYIRSSGSFTSNLFLPLSDVTDLTSRESVIYNGYY